MLPQLVENSLETKSSFSLTDLIPKRVRKQKKIFQMSKMIQTMSMGAGVQTTALLLMYPKKYDYIIFADTGDEKKETYYYIEKYLKPFCVKNNIKWETVRHKHGFTLMEWCMKRKIIPIRTRRWCTQDFKIKPINRFLRKIGATKKNPAHVDIGISLDESHRANFSKKDVQYVKKEYPLLDRKITRNECYAIIEKHGFPIPPKSGCDFCMFQRRREILKLKAADPERFHKIVLMEQNDRYYPKKPMIGKYPLESIENINTMDQYMEEEEIEDTCDSGHCFT